MVSRVMPAAWVSISACAEGESVGVRAARVEQAVCGRRPGVRLVAVSKFQPAEAVREAHAAGLRHFAENYMQELVAKAQELADLDEIRWHFVGRLQNKRAAKTMVRRVPRLWCVETLEKASIVDALESACAEVDREPLRVMIQVNTSGEESKSGIPWESTGEISDLASHVRDGCPHLDLYGLMTIGAPGDLAAFERLKSVKAVLAAPHLKLSMGMSGDYQEAIDAGSDQVRVGTAIFGARPLAKPTS